MSHFCQMGFPAGLSAIRIFFFFWRALLHWALSETQSRLAPQSRVEFDYYQPLSTDFFFSMCQGLQARSREEIARNDKNLNCTVAISASQHWTMASKNQKTNPQKNICCLECIEACKFCKTFFAIKDRIDAMHCKQAYRLMPFKLVFNSPNTGRTLLLRDRAFLKSLLQGQKPQVFLRIWLRTRSPARETIT